MPTMIEPKSKVKPQTVRKVQPPYNVILLNDDDHTVDYVVEMLKKLFNHPVEKGFQLANEVHDTGRAIVATVSFELAELKQEQIHEYGADPRISHSKGSMTCELEPAE